MNKISALLATSRMANVPSVISNVFTGMVLGFLLHGEVPWDHATTVPAVIIACCLYVAGNFLNDWHDVEWDRRHRPERAIPSGLFPRSLYLLIAIVLFAVAWIIALSLSKTVFLVSLGITVLVISYTLLHKTTAASIWLMGGCRAALYLLGWAAMDAGFRSIGIRYINSITSVLGYVKYVGGLLVLPMIGLCCYIAGISLLARFESQADAPAQAKKIALFLLVSPCLTHLCYWVTDAVWSHEFPWLLFSAVPFVIWTMIAVRKSLPLPRKIARLLAGIALVDSVYLLAFYAAFADELFPLAAVTALLLPFFGWLASLLLQKITPAS